MFAILIIGEKVHLMVFLILATDGCFNFSGRWLRKRKWWVYTVSSSFYNFLFLFLLRKIVATPLLRFHDISHFLVFFYWNKLMLLSLPNVTLLVSMWLQPADVNLDGLCCYFFYLIMSLHLDFVIYSATSLKHMIFCHILFFWRVL